MELNPTSYDLITYLWVIGLSIWSGIIGLSLKLRQQKDSRYKIFDTITDLSASILVGILTFYTCESLTIPKLQTMVLIILASHTGPKTLFLYRQCFERNLNFLFRKFLGLRAEDCIEPIDEEIPPQSEGEDDATIK